jgi:hypothetical protein
MQIILRIILISIKYVLLLKGGFPHPAQVGARHRRKGMTDGRSIFRTPGNCAIRSHRWSKILSSPCAPRLATGHARNKPRNKQWEADLGGYALSQTLHRPAQFAGRFRIYGEKLHQISQHRACVWR